MKKKKNTRFLNNNKTPLNDIISLDDIILGTMGLMRSNPPSFRKLEQEIQKIKR